MVFQFLLTLLFQILNPVPSFNGQNEKMYSIYMTTYCILILQYYYSIKDISIGGRCVCNGHAEACNAQDPNDPYK